ncbi:hypothetical protein B0A55_00300 [Friedmanniomyces simplex]|uniref:Phosphoribomutase n=1 Tax=Friedmanniomyces simplex TaxID=329884 RepID=A0A4U0Y0Q5_9PEZI|nr:hypothetical protein B0A55_00300 [Friedmanniomyces simplex]
MTDIQPIGRLAARWLQEDRDLDSRREIEALVAAKDEAELERRLRKRIAFGTAGLRSSMKAGYAHMNSLTVLQASQGLADYILAQRRGTAGYASVTIGFDARHNSEKFARLAAGVFLAKGIRVLWFGILVHTPMIPFAVSHFSAAAGVMITASHNPKIDNGFKVYWANGCQIIPPHDKGIALAIDNVKDIIEWSTSSVDHSSLVQQPISCISSKRKPQPDPDFQTVPFPNPEEKGALALACQEAQRNGSKIIVSNDPDADRFAAAECLQGGQWHQFTGNQMGILLASNVLEASSVPRDKMVMLASTVSSRMLAAMARYEGFTFKETLTGFKWLGNVAQQTEKEGLIPVFAFEEAIGYMFPSVAWDKDGIAAASVFLSARRKWHVEGVTAYQKLQQLYQKYGYFEDANTYLISPSFDVTQATFAAVRTSNNGIIPTHVGKRRVERWRDLTLGYDTGTADRKPDLPVDPTAQMITCELGDGVVFTARGSGTEPKIKLYIEATAGSSAEAKRLANEVLGDLVREWFAELKLAGL